MATKLIADIVEAPTIKLTSGAVDGYFLKTDSDGNATWTPISASQVYKGTWNADTNTPTLADSTGVQGHYYRVTTAGTSDLDDSGSSGNKSISYDVGDDVIHNGTFWERIPGVGYTLQTATDAVLGGVKIGSGVIISNGVISVSTDAETLDGLDSNDFVRRTDNIDEEVTGNKDFRDTTSFNTNTKIRDNGAAVTIFSQNYVGTQAKRMLFRPNGDVSQVGEVELGEDGNFEVHGDVTADSFIGNGANVSSVDALTLGGLQRAPVNQSNGIVWNYIPVVKSDGLMEVGKAIDFHLTSDSGVDNNGRLQLTSDENLKWSGDLTAHRFFESSDKRLKTNIKKISKSIYTYEFKKELGRKRYGTIAQEIQKTNPEVVKKLEDGGMMSVNYNSFLSLKLAEQENENKEQNNKIDSLQQQIDELKELIKNK